MKKIFLILLLCMFQVSIAFGQVALLFYEYSSPFTSFFSHTDAQEYTFRYFYVRGSFLRKAKEATAGKWLLDSLGRGTHFSRDPEFDTWGPAQLTRQYREDGCPYFPGSQIDESGWTHNLDNPNFSMHCSSGFVDTIASRDFREMTVYARDSIGRIINKEEWIGGLLKSKVGLHYDESGELKKISGTEMAVVTYSFEEKVVYVYYQWLIDPHYTIQKYYLNDLGLVLRIEIDNYVKNLKRFKPDEIYLYEWKMRGE